MLYPQEFPDGGEAAAYAHQDAHPGEHSRHRGPDLTEVHHPQQLHGVGIGDALRAAGIGVIMADARINQSACTDEGHETFHEKVEGLGFLPNVPLTRTAEDARALADSLVKVSAL